MIYPLVTYTNSCNWRVASHSRLRKQINDKNTHTQLLSHECSLLENAYCTRKKYLKSESRPLYVSYGSTIFARQNA